ncbi:metal ABC transporter permease [uncultured Subdoligranulum sp.]|uniref:Metal ABC transporter permease n=1 Tax=Candidatus Gemmiger excrementavium TaxID=2838608 RepID=A0A9D2F3K0_9FIRM|nr:metal ABC transporter permease [uncultured Subdoligranulum sp.]HIZ48552.1 metal ABC transporter permease [Candidatus Gemmiger excrementavium]
MIATLQYYWNFPFVRYALVVGVLIALCSSLFGVTLVLKRFSYLGDGLSHVAFGAMSVATVLRLADSMLLVLPVTILCAVLLLRGGSNAKIHGDAAVGMLSVGALALGYLVVNLFSATPNLAGDVCSTLFGSTSILTLTLAEVWLCVVLAVAVVVLFVALYHKIFAVTFDEAFARACGVGARRWQLLLAAIIAVIIVLAMYLVGSLLISALILFPALAAMRVCRSFLGVTVCAAVFSVFCAAGGIVAAVLAGTPVGATIVAVNMAGFGLFWMAGALRGGAS